MSFLTKRRLAAVAAVSVIALPVGGVAQASPDGSTGPSSSDAAYLVPNAPGVSFTSLLTAGDTIRGYKMAGTPDGLGAFDNHDGTFTVLMNHEFGALNSAPRSHGNTSGSFVSRWVIDKRTLRVISGRDQIKNLITAGSKNIDRLCSADLPELTAFYNPSSRRGYKGRIFMNGEETTGGRAFGHVVDSGDSYELAALGKAAWENLAANPSTGNHTVVVGQSDGTPQNVFVYSGEKQNTGSPVDKAGLTNGTTKAISVTGFPSESGGADFPEGPQPFTLSATGTSFDRPEDGAWDPRHPNDYYFATTASMAKHSRLWKASFKDARHPELGGMITKVLEGPADDSPSSVGPKMMDNLTVDDRGQVLIQEDPGGNDYLAGVFLYDTRRDSVRRIARHDPQRFTPGGASFDTNNEESSGVIPASFLGKGKYLLDVQDHLAVADPAVFEKGQLLVMSLPKGRDGHDDED